MKTNLENELAFDYVSQEWVTGIRAVLLNKQQASDALVLLTGPKSAEYARFVGISDVESAVDALRVTLERLKGLEATAPIGGLVSRGECVEVGGAS